MTSPNRLILAPKRTNLPKSCFFCFFLALPTCAAIRLSHYFDYRFILGWTTVASIFGYALCYSDKRKAQSGQWRISEANLHFVELLGGWAGSFLAQRQFHHKTSKRSYQIAFWAIVLLYQFLSLDYLLDWHLSLRLTTLIKA